MAQQSLVTPGVSLRAPQQSRTPLGQPDLAQPSFLLVNRGTAPLTLIPTAFKMSQYPRGGGPIRPALYNYGRWTTIPTELCMMQVSNVLKVW